LQNGTGETPPSEQGRGEFTRRRRVATLFEVLNDLPETIRENALDRECADEPEIRAELRDMLGLTERAANNPTQFGPWRVVDVLGHGGMGAVYRVERDAGDYVQVAALKRIRVGLDTQASRQRFLRERQILARLRHENIASLVDGGLEGDTPWFAMELVIGQRIDHWCDARKIDVRKRVILFLQVLEAVAEAHRALIIHRDVKPGNVLVEDNGHVKLLDFGVAKLIEDEAEHTKTHDRVFTPEFASPEQLNNEVVGTASDIYQLGMLLYDLLAGRNAYGVTTGTSLLTQLTALEQNPQRLPRAVEMGGEDVARARGTSVGHLIAEVTGDLNAIVTHAISRNPRDRYHSADAFADDLHAWLDGRPVKVREPTLMYRASRFVKRNRWGVAGGALLVVAIATGVAATLWQAKQAREAQAIAEAARDAARSNEQITAAVEEAFQQMLTHALMNDGGNGITVRQMIDQSLARLRPDSKDPLDSKLILLLDMAESFMATSQTEDAERIVKQVEPVIDRLSAEQPRLGIKRDGIRARILADRKDKRALAYFARIRHRVDGLERPLEEGLFEDYRQIANYEILVLNKFGMLKEGAQRARELFERTRDRYGVDNPRTLEVARTYTYGLMRVNENGEAEKIRAYSKDYVAKHKMQNTALEMTVQNQLAGLLKYDAKRQHESEAAFIRSLEIASVPRFDPLGTNRVNIRFALADLYEMQGRHAEYDTQMSAVKAAIPKLYEDQAINWRDWYLRMARHAWLLGDVEQSRRYAQQGLDHAMHLETFDLALNEAGLRLALARGLAKTAPATARAQVADALALVKPYPYMFDAATFYGYATEALALAGDADGARAMAQKAAQGITADRYLGAWRTQQVRAQIALASVN
jgi:tRNA A-37 threonylcarbamoyl transferase component Bud32